MLASSAVLSWVGASALAAEPLAQPSPAQPSPAQPSPAQPSPAATPPTSEAEGIQPKQEPPAGSAAENETASTTDASSPAARDADASTASAGEKSSRFEALPPNPALNALDEPSRSEPPKPRVRRFELGGRLGLTHRPSSDSAVEYAAGPSFGAHGMLVLSEWFGLGLIGMLERHAVDVGSDALGFDGLEASQPALRVMRLGAEAEPRLKLTERLRLGFAVGLTWNRLEAEPMTAEEPVPFELSRRSGVLVEAGLNPRLAFRAFSRVGFSLWGSFAVPLIQSGDLFSNPESDLQTVRQDTGQLLAVDGFPEFSYALSSHLSVDVLF